ncbi:type 4a pilus biogenesis protein PilO [Candidatus Microgenomates bacterium]|nr:type 4a pilus biogenesis protein PilO [Candidatus Microgenomates bacterium]
MLEQNPKIKKVLDKQKKSVSKFFSVGENQIGSIFLVVILVVMVVGNFVLRPVNINYKNQKIAIKNYTTEKALLESKKKKLENLSQDLLANKIFIDQVKDILPETEQVPELLVALEEIAKKHSLYITNFSPKPKVEERTVVRGEGGTAGDNIVATADREALELQFDLTGSYASLLDFLKDLENNIRPLSVKVINASGGGVDTITNTQLPLRFSITADVYYQPRK